MSASPPRRRGTSPRTFTPWSAPPMRGDVRPWRRVLPGSALLLLAGCDGPQSSLDPAGPAAASIHLLGLVMYAGAAAVALLVTALMLVPFLRRGEPRAVRRLFLWGGGVVLPGLTLTALVPFTLTA